MDSIGLLFITIATLFTVAGATILGTHVQVSDERPNDYYRVYPGVFMTATAASLPYLIMSSGPKCITDCENHEDCSSVDYYWLIGHCKHFKQSIMDEEVSDFDAHHPNNIGIVHVEVPRRTDRGVTATTSDQEPRHTAHMIEEMGISDHRCFVYLGFAYDATTVINYVIERKENVVSGIQCVIHCEYTDGCQAVSYRWMDGKCILLRGEKQTALDSLVRRLRERADWVHIELGDQAEKELGDPVEKEHRKVKTGPSGSKKTKKPETLKQEDGGKRRPNHGKSRFAQEN